MTDLVSRLRERHSFLCDEAAEEIERLHGIIADNSLLNRTDNERLRGLLGEAADDIEHWGGYASEYFKDKWHLEDDIKKYRDAALAGAAVQPTVRMGITDGWPRCLTCENDLVPGTFWCAEHQPTEYYPGLPHHPDCPTRNAAQQPTAPTSGGHDGD